MWYPELFTLQSLAKRFNEEEKAQQIFHPLWVNPVALAEVIRKESQIPFWRRWLAFRFARRYVPEKKPEPQLSGQLKPLKKVYPMTQAEQEDMLQEAASMLPPDFGQQRTMKVTDGGVDLNAAKNASYYERSQVEEPEVTPIFAQVVSGELTETVDEFNDDIPPLNPDYVAANGTTPQSVVLGPEKQSRKRKTTTKNGQPKLRKYDGRQPKNSERKRRKKAFATQSREKAAI
ncbi:MAG TPA: hypothetical protein VF209_05515 [Patescibacteria group bacterium]